MTYNSNGTGEKSPVKRILELRKTPDAPIFTFNLGFDGKIHKAGNKDDPEFKAMVSSKDLSVNLIDLACVLIATTVSLAAAIAALGIAFKVKYKKRF